MFSRLGLHIGGCFSAARRINIFRANLTPEVMLACLHRVARLDTTDRPRPRLRSGLPATRPALRYRPLRNIGSISTLSGAPFAKPRIRGSMLQLPIMRELHRPQNYRRSTVPSHVRVLATPSSPVERDHDFERAGVSADGPLPPNFALQAG
jgi:hypothetical protein